MRHRRDHTLSPGVAGASLLLAGALLLPSPALASGPLPPLKGLPKAPSGFKLGGDAARGKPVYKRMCQSCHGSKGKGNGLAGRFLKPRPRDFTRPEMAARGDWALYYVTKKGGRAVGLSLTMVAFEGALDDRAIRDVVAYIKGFMKKQPKK